MRHAWRDSEQKGGVASRVPVADFRAWVASLLEAGSIHMQSGPTTYTKAMTTKPPSRRVTQLGTEHRRQHTQHLHETGSNGHMHNVLDRVKQWVMKRVSGSHAPAITAPMVVDMVHNLGKRGRTASQIRAALLYMAGTEGLRVQWRVEGRGGRQIDGVKEAQAVLEGWLGSVRARSITAAAQRHLQQGSCRTSDYHMLDFGQGWEKSI